MLAISPQIGQIALAQKTFMVRTTRMLAEAGIRQFLDVGTGFPPDVTIHGTAQAIDPASRIVYVDNDPLVLTHARALLVGATADSTTYLHADLRDPEQILREAGRSIDLAQPTAVMLLGVLAHIVDDAEARRIVGTLLDAVAVGSYLVLCDGTEVFDPVGIAHSTSDRVTVFSGSNPCTQRRVHDGVHARRPAGPGPN